MSFSIPERIHNLRCQLHQNPKPTILGANHLRPTCVKYEVSSMSDQNHMYLQLVVGYEDSKVYGFNGGYKMKDNPRIFEISKSYPAVLKASDTQWLVDLETMLSDIEDSERLSKILL